MSQPNEALLAWVRRQVADITPDGGISRFELWHAVDGDHPERLETVSLDEDVDADIAGETLWDVAEHDAATRTPGMRQRYVVLSFRQDQEESDSRHPFTMISSPTMAGAGSFSGDTESPNEKGVTSHFMRHDTQMHQMMMAVMESSAGRMMRDAEMARRRAESAEGKLQEMFQVHQDLLDRKHERDLENAREESRARRHEELMSMVFTMAPLVIGKLLGGLPGSSARDFSVSKFLEGLSEEEMMGIIQNLKGPNQLKLMELYQSYKEDRQKEMDKRHPLLRDQTPDDEAEEPRH